MSGATDRSARRLTAELKRRFNPRLHPLLAIAIGLGLLALCSGGGEAPVESHSGGEVLERLLGPDLDAEHGPLFWLREIREDTALVQEARNLCRGLDPIRHPNCQLLATLDRATERLEISPRAQDEESVALEDPGAQP